MKVAFCTREFDAVSGGQNTWLCRFLPDLRRHGIQSRVLCFTLTGEEELPTVRCLRRAGIECATSSHEEEKYTDQRVRWIVNQLAADPPDVFVANMVIPAAYYAGRWLQAAGVPTVGICHGGGMYHLYPGVLDQFVYGRAAYRVSAFVAVSDYLAQDVLRKHPENIVVRRIPCGIPIPKDLARRPNGRLRLAYVGQLVEERKRISEVTRALCRAVREIEGTEAFIYGEGPDRDVVEQILRDEAAGLPFQLVGFVEHDLLLTELANCHAVVLLSDHEGLGLALLEGMACGVVPIGLRGAPGVSEFVIDNVTGLLAADRGDSFVAVVRRLREDTNLWERLSRAARTQAESEYSDEICIARWQELFRELVHNRGPRKALQMPRRLRLPDVHPALAAIDRRKPRLHQRLIGGLGRFAKRVPICSDF